MKIAGNTLNGHSCFSLSVIPAKAGIQRLVPYEGKAKTLDSRLKMSGMTGGEVGDDSLEREVPLFISNGVQAANLYEGLI